MKITKKELRQIIKEEINMQRIPTPDEIEEWWVHLPPGVMKSITTKIRVGLDSEKWNAREWESVIDYYVQIEMGDPRGYQRGRNI